MTFIDRWRQRRDDEWWERWEREHKWDALARYNSERARGLVHTPEYVSFMVDEQRRFNQEHGAPADQAGLPIRLEPSP